MNKSLFITFEGGEGVGKSTQAELLKKWMEERSIDTVLTKEPGESRISECVKIREMLLDPKSDLSSSAELLLFLADRAQHVERFIKPELASGSFVICDRFTDSTLAYQIAARGFSRTELKPLLDFASGGLNPDVTFIIDMPVNVALERAREKSLYKWGDRMEREDVTFHEKVRFGFRKIAENLSEQNRVKLINAGSKTIEQIHEEIVDHISQKIWKE